MTKNIIYISHAEKGPSGGAKIIYRHSEKINALKNNPKSVLQMVKDGATKDEVLEKTGHTVTLP